MHNARNKVLLILMVAFIALMSACEVDTNNNLITSPESKTQVVDSSGNIITIDEVTRAITSIEYEHHEIHEGNSFKSDGFDGAMGNGDTLILAFKTPDTTRWAHLVIWGWALAKAHIEITEAPTWNTGTGTQELVYNRNRNSATTSTLLEDTTGAFVDNDALVLNPTGLAGGTIIHHFYFNAKKSGGDMVRGISELILKQNTTYAIILTTDEASNAGQIELNWYEHTSF